MYVAFLVIVSVFLLHALLMSGKSKCRGCGARKVSVWMHPLSPAPTVLHARCSSCGAVCKITRPLPMTEWSDWQRVLTILVATAMGSSAHAQVDEQMRFLLHKQVVGPGFGFAGWVVASDVTNPLGQRGLLVAGLGYKWNPSTTLGAEWIEIMPGAFVIGGKSPIRCSTCARTSRSPTASVSRPSTCEHSEQNVTS